jgi:hypothetical protein
LSFSADIIGRHSAFGLQQADVTNRPRAVATA